ncbi:4Fe-4S binding protein [Candidatus Bipolaricaulota bacterium]|nr:4Fe-4S binding protein [Candidatus Bipolaricaulota bacterium]
MPQAVPKRISVVDVERCVGCQCCVFACARRIGVGGTADARIDVRSAGGMRKGFVVIVCRACPDPPCARVCPTDALTPRAGGGVIFRDAACIGCGNCREACPFGAVLWDNEQRKPMICVYCGVCASFCPYEVLAYEETKEDDDAPVRHAG